MEIKKKKSMKEGQPGTNRTSLIGEISLCLMKPSMMEGWEDTYKLMSASQSSPLAAAMSHLFTQKNAANL